MSDAVQKPSWDVFISHASEDKETIARPSAEALTRRGVKVWFDAEQLTLGDSLRRSIDQGLVQSRYGIVILSQHFFAKEWPMKELDGLVAREDGKEKVILPVWHEISEAEVRSFSPMLADKLAVSTAGGMEKVVSEVLRVICPGARFEPELILIPAGEFLMGSDPSKDKNAREEEQPQHSIYLPDYYIAKTPVTNTQYRAFVQDARHELPRGWDWHGPEYPQGKADHPVVNVSWHDAMAYCQWLAEATGKAYRLASEAEWEKAARGTDGRIWPWGNEWDARRCNSSEGGPGDTMPVGQYSPQGDSPYGCVDMVGNVWEWTLSLYKDYPYDLEDGREDPRSSGPRVLRGSAFNYSGRGVRCACRRGYVRLGSIGFRLCVAPSYASEL
jgi:formylglycine-generating enzyme required for sulfatase activity